MTEWCVLGVARMLFTWRTGDVASKSHAGTWLADELPAHRAVAEHAVALRRDGSVGRVDDRVTLAAVTAVMHAVVDAITAR